MWWWTHHTNDLLVVGNTDLRKRHLKPYFRDLSGQLCQLWGRLDDGETVAPGLAGEAADIGNAGAVEGGAPFPSLAACSRRSLGYVLYILLSLLLLCEGHHRIIHSLPHVLSRHLASPWQLYSARPSLRP